MTEAGELISDEMGFALHVLGKPIVDPARPLLRHIDPYGNTVFNCFQMRSLIDEIDSLLAQPDLLTLEQVRFLSVLRACCEEGDEEPHRYLWLIGD